MKSRSAKNKGARLQKMVAEAISELTGIATGKDEMIASREMGQSGTDIRLIGQARKEFPFAVECKNCETWSINKWIEQAKSNEEKNMQWLLIVKCNQLQPYVIIDEEYHNLNLYGGGEFDTTVAPLRGIQTKLKKLPKNCTDRYWVGEQDKLLFYPMSEFFKELKEKRGS